MSRYDGCRNGSQSLGVSVCRSGRKNNPLYALLGHWPIHAERISRLLHRTRHVPQGFGHRLNTEQFSLRRNPAQVSNVEPGKLGIAMLS
ncbi:MAG: hypothetical protein KAX70_06585 [Pseudomonas sp.]|nr:hypothetical protein [Pseudomonas sp.]